MVQVTVSVAAILAQGRAQRMAQTKAQLLVIQMGGYLGQKMAYETEI